MIHSVFSRFPAAARPFSGSFVPPPWPGKNKGLRSAGAIIRNDRLLHHVMSGPDRFPLSRRQHKLMGYGNRASRVTGRRSGREKNDFLRPVLPILMQGRPDRNIRRQLSFSFAARGSGIGREGKRNASLLTSTTPIFGGRPSEKRAYVISKADAKNPVSAMSLRSRSFRTRSLVPHQLPSVRKNTGITRVIEGRDILVLPRDKAHHINSIGSWNDVVRQDYGSRKKSGNNVKQRMRIAVRSSKILHSIPREQGLQRDMERDYAISAVPDFPGVARRDHFSDRKKGGMQGAFDPADQIMRSGEADMPLRELENSSGPFGGSFRVNSLRRQSAVVDEIAIPQYPNMSFGFM